MACRIAILTDIHGNAPALRAVLADIDREPGIEQIYCLSDMVDIGPDSNEVLGLLCARSNLSMLMGNHEQYVLAMATGQDPGVKGEVATHAAWIAGVPVFLRAPGGSGQGVHPEGVSREHHRRNGR